MSTRAIGGGAGTGPGALAANFLVEGTMPQTVLIRVIGHTLVNFEVAGALTDPILTVYNGRGAPIGGNDNWGGSSALMTAFSAVGAVPFGSATSRDAALLLTANPGVYTAVVSGAGETTGVVVLEVYEYDTPASSSRIPYIATRGNIIGSLTSGFTIASATTSVLVRSAGPALGATGIGGVMSDPTIAVSRNSAVVATNDNWTPSTSNATTTAGLIPFANGSRDAALLLNLDPAAYTAQLSHLVGTDGIALLEVAQIDANRATTFAPALLVPPYPVSASVGGNVTLSAVAIGRPAPTYQWRKNGVNIGGQSAAGLTLTNLQTTDAGNYSVVLANTAGTTTSTDWALTVAPLAGAPTIVTQPTEWAVPAGATATLTVTASGTAPLSYQWSRNGVAINGATSSTLTISNVQVANAGSYSVQVTNSQGTVTSAAIVLTVVFPPSITTQPVSQSAPAGSAATFTVIATGTPPLSYQWRRNGVNVAGATNATFTIAPVRVPDAGSYTCVVSNAVASATSNPATLAVEETYAGTYFGTFAGSAGSWAFVVRSDGIGSFVGFLNNPRGGILVTTRVGADGRFRSNGSFIPSQPAPGSAPELTFTLAGSINNAGQVTGTLEGLGRTLSGAREAPGGETAAYSGIYQATGSDGGITIVVVGSSRQVMALRFVPIPVAGGTSRAPGTPPVAALTIGASTVDGGLGSMDSSGSFLVPTENNTTIIGRVDPTGSTLSGTVVSPSEPLVLISGSETEGVGPPVIVIPPSAQIVTANSAATLSLTVGGKTPLAYQWSKDSVDLPGATGATHVIAAAQVADTGGYVCTITNSEGRVTSDVVQLTVLPPAPTTRLVNLSILTQLTSAADSFALGYVVNGDSTAPGKSLVIRVAGPSLGALGQAGSAADPKLEIFAGATKTGENDDWGGSPGLAAAMARVGAFGFANPGSKDAAILTNVSTTDNSVIVSATGPGRVIAELYDATSFDPAGRRVINVSVRKPIGSGLTAGFVIGGTGSKTVLIRAIGPTLGTAFNTPDTIDDPQVQLVGRSGLIKANDNWGGTSELAAAFRAAGAFELPAASRDAALIASLAPGEYTVEVTGVNNTTGTCLVEIYDLDR